MKATIYKDFTLQNLVEALSEELKELGIECHISWVSNPPLPRIKAAVHSDCYWLEFLDFIADCFPVVCLYRYVEGILYIAIMLDQNQKEKL